MIEVEKLIVTLDTMEALKMESLAKSQFEQANIYDRARLAIEERGSGSPDWPSNHPIG